MAIARASRDMLSARTVRSTSDVDERTFRQRRLAIDELIATVEDVVAAEEPEIPCRLRDEAGRLLALVYGVTPPWILEVERPSALLDHLFIAEGRLRQDHYGESRVDLDE